MLGHFNPPTNPLWHAANTLLSASSHIAVQRRCSSGSCLLACTTRWSLAACALALHTCIPTSCKQTRNGPDAYVTALVAAGTMCGRPRFCQSYKQRAWLLARLQRWRQRPPGMLQSLRCRSP